MIPLPEIVMLGDLEELKKRAADSRGDRLIAPEESTALREWMLESSLTTDDRD
jgi:hypothetical protein